MALMIFNIKQTNGGYDETDNFNSVYIFYMRSCYSTKYTLLSH